MHEETFICDVKTDKVFWRLDAKLPADKDHAPV